MAEIDLRRRQEQEKYRAGGGDRDESAEIINSLNAEELALAVLAHRLGYAVEYGGKVRKYRSKAEKAERDSELSYY